MIPALIENCAPTCSEAGGIAKNETAIGIGGTIVIFPDTDRLVSATEVAVTVTVVPAGIADGAVYVTAPPSALALKVPHPLGVPHVIVYVTAAFPLLPGLIGYVVAANSVAAALTAIDVGGAATQITAVGFTCVIVWIELPDPAHPLRPPTRPKPRRKRPVLPPNIACLVPDSPASPIRRRRLHDAHERRPSRLRGPPNSHPARPWPC